MHKLENSDLQKYRVMKTAFEQTSLSDFRAEATCTFSVGETGPDARIIRVKGNVNLNSSVIEPNQRWVSKALVYFPEHKYGIEFVREQAAYTIEFICEWIRPKEYFNLVLTDKRGYLISSTTYVFNADNIMPYPVQDKDISPYTGWSKLEEKEGRLVFSSILPDTSHSEPLTIKHTWQNVGQHVVFQAEQQNDKAIYKSSLACDEMCSGMWMIIATDSQGRLMTQYVVHI